MLSDREIVQLYTGGATSAEIAARADVTVTRRTVSRIVARSGVPVRRGRARHQRKACPACGRVEESKPSSRLHCSTCWPKHPAADPRPCGQCGEMFVPPANRVARGAGRFCTYGCWNLWRTGKPQREWAAA